MHATAAYRALESELKASPLAGKIAWHIVARRRDRLHATICCSLARGEALPDLTLEKRRALQRLGPIWIELRGLFSGNVNRGRLYLRAYPERRDGANTVQRIQAIVGCRPTRLYVVGIFNFVADLDADAGLPGGVRLVDRRDLDAHQLVAQARGAVAAFGVHRLEAAGRQPGQGSHGQQPNGNPALSRPH